MGRPVRRPVRRPVMWRCVPAARFAGALQVQPALVVRPLRGCSMDMGYGCQTTRHDLAAQRMLCFGRGLPRDHREEPEGIKIRRADFTTDFTTSLHSRGAFFKYRFSRTVDEGRLA